MISYFIVVINTFIMMLTGEETHLFSFLTNGYEDFEAIFAYIVNSFAAML